MINEKKIKENLTLFLNEKISNKELCMFSISEMHDFLREDSISKNDALLYPVLNELCDIDAISIYEASKLLGILNGTENATYSFSMGLKSGKDDKFLRNLRDNIQMYFIKEQAIRAEAEKMFDMIEKYCAGDSEYIYETIRKDICHLIMSSVTLNEDRIIFERSNVLFPNLSYNDKSAFWNRVIRMIECCLGETMVDIFINYSGGKRLLSIVI